MQLGSYRVETGGVLWRRQVILRLGVAIILGLLYWLFFWKQSSSAVCKEYTFACAAEKLYVIGAIDTKDIQDARFDNLIDRQSATKVIAKVEDALHPLEKSSVLCTFSDEKYIDAEYKDYVQNVCQRKIMQGRSDGRFFPKATLTTAEVAVMLSRMEGKSIAEASTGEARYVPYQVYFLEKNLGAYTNVQVSIDSETPASFGWLVAVLAQYIDLEKGQ